MKADQIDQALVQKFLNHRLVFWHDTDGEFREEVRGRFPNGSACETGPLSQVRLLDLTKTGGFAAKLLLERQDPEGQYLIYSVGELPEAEADWLLDIRLYSAEFQADMSSLWWQELGLERLELTQHLRSRSKFLASATRRSRLAELVAPQDDETALDLKMMAVLAKIKIPTLFELLQAICQHHLERARGEFDLDLPSELLETLDKMSLLGTFWQLVGQIFPSSEDPPTLAGLLRRLFISELFQQSREAKFPTLSHLKLEADGARNAVVFLTQWRDSASRGEVYEALARAVEAEQPIADAVDGLSLAQLRGVFTFWSAERALVTKLRNQVLELEQTVSSSELADIVSQRKAGSWLSGPSRGQSEREAIAEAYEAVLAAAQMFELSRTESHLFESTSAEQAVGAYCQSLYRFDQTYRRYCVHSRPSHNLGWDLLKELTDRIERLYDQGYLQPQARAWDRLLDEGFLATWKLPGVISQQAFYAKAIKPHLDTDDRKRAFVIISDAFRYEAAVQLKEAMNGRDGLTAELQPLLGVLPSFTKLGMASLLPRRSLKMEGAEVYVDGKPLAGIEARSEHLKAYQGMAIKAETFLQLKTDEVRELTRDARTVYIYHNVIDSRGDNAATEEQTFEAVAQTLSELESLISICVSKLNASKVWVTADHGFLFQRQAPTLTNRSAIAQKPTGAALSKKRYLIGTELGDSPDVHHGRVETTSGAEGSMEFWVPRGTNRFHFAGGARFVHGGAMPQEVVVPLLVVSQVRGKKAPTTKVEKVGIQVLGTRHRITTPVYRFEMIQTEPVSERRKAVTVRMAIFHEGKPVTSIETVTFDSASAAMEERTKSVVLHLAQESFDKRASYVLMLKDQDNPDRDVFSIPVVIDRSFDDDF